MEKFQLHDAEFKFASIVWENEPLKSTELVRICQDELGWKKSTTYTVLKKLCDKGILKNEEAIVTSIVSQADVQRYESTQIVDRAFSGSLPRFLAAFLGERNISEKEAEELKKLIEEARQ